MLNNEPYCKVLPFILSLSQCNGRSEQNVYHSYICGTLLLLIIYYYLHILFIMEKPYLMQFNSVQKQNCIIK